MLQSVKNYVVPLAALALPVLALAQNSVEGIFEIIIRIINVYVIPLIIGLAVVWFLIGVFKYVMSAGDEDAQTSGRSMMINGIIAIFVMVSVWGLVNLLGGTFRLGNSQGPAQPLPQIPRQ